VIDGMVLENGCQTAGGAVVADHVPSGILVAGVPARKLRDADMK
jgi:serine acetyltransferase